MQVKVILSVHKHPATQLSANSEQGYHFFLILGSFC